PGFQCRDSGEFRFERLEAGRLDGTFAHAGSPIVSDLLLNGRAVRIVFAGGFQGIPKYSFVPQLKAATGAPGDLVGRNRMRAQPFVAGVFVKVMTGTERLVDAIGVEVLEFGDAGWIGAPRGVRRAGVVRRETLRKSCGGGARQHNRADQASN